MRRTRRRREADEVDLQAGRLFPGNLVAQILSAEAAVRLGLEPEAGEHLQRARLLVTNRTLPILRETVTSIGISVTAMGNKAGRARDAGSSAGTSPARGRSSNTAASSARGRGSKPAAAPGPVRKRAPGGSAENREQAGQRRGSGSTRLGALESARPGAGSTASAASGKLATGSTASAASAKSGNGIAAGASAKPGAGGATSAASAALDAPAAARPKVELVFRPSAAALDLPLFADPVADLRDYRLRLAALEVRRLQSFEALLALGAVRGVDRYEYQMRTVTRVLREFFGRVLLADEVGLGKTVEACLCLKEYMLRGLVTRVLILVPPSLRAQWRDELSSKFAIEAVVIDGDEARADPELWRQDGVLIASLGLARLEPHASHIARGSFDLVIVDEAHRLKNRRSRSWQLVDRLRSRFLLLLSATPVENDLIEIYNLLSLLKPGLFSTEAEFRRAFVRGGAAGDVARKVRDGQSAVSAPLGRASKARAVKDPLKLRSLLREVMIRNTRALAEAKLPPRFATTLRAAPSASEAELYASVCASVRLALETGRLARSVAGEILRATGSSPAAAAALLESRLDRDLAERARALDRPAKDALLVDLLARRRGEKILLFAAHLSTLEHVAEVVRAAGRSAAFFHGGLAPREKEAAIAAFAADREILVSSESGGEGFNLQFARTIVNYDLPWNPMRIEQRIGRVHRIGQTREVFIFNLVTAGTIEEEILRVLDEKINMFELVIGEVEAILGRLGDDEREFQDLVLEMYASAGDAQDLRARFEELGARLVEARGEYQAVQRLEEAAFGRDLEA